MKKCLGSVLIFILMLSMVACSSNPPVLKGLYQSEIISEDVVRIFISNDNTFIEFITNVEVNRGTYTQKGNGVYQFYGNEKDFEITLKDDNSFEIFIPKLFGSNPIQMEYIDGIPATLVTDFDDETIKEKKELFN